MLPALILTLILPLLLLGLLPFFALLLLLAITLLALLLFGALTIFALLLLLIAALLLVSLIPLALGDPAAGPGSVRGVPAAGPGSARVAPAAGPGSGRGAPAADSGFDSVLILILVLVLVLVFVLILVLVLLSQNEGREIVARKGRLRKQHGRNCGSGEEQFIQSHLGLAFPGEVVLVECFPGALDVTRVKSAAASKVSCDSTMAEGCLLVTAAGYCPAFVPKSAARPEARIAQRHRPHGFGSSVPQVRPLRYYAQHADVGIFGRSHCCRANVDHNSRITSGSAEVCAMPVTDTI